MAKKSNARSKSKARRAASKKKSTSSSSKSSSSSTQSKINSIKSQADAIKKIIDQRAADEKKSSTTTSTKGKYETTDGKSFSDKAQATAHQRALNSGKGATEEKEKEKDDEDYAKADDTGLRNTAEFKALDKEDQEAVLAVFNAIATNDVKKANQLADSFRAASKINDPIFKEQLMLAVDAIERGYVEIDKEAEFKEKQMKTRLEDVKKDFLAKKEFLTLEQASQLRGIERQYTVDLEDTRQDLAVRGMTGSSRRIQKEKLVEDSYGDMRESTNRKFAFELQAEDNQVARSDRDTQRELARLAEITKAGKLDFLRRAEQQVGSKNLPNLNTDYKPVGGLYGDIGRDSLQNTLSAATSFVF